jgi:hypothetical protein
MSIETFRSLFQGHRRVVIPMIQRDYAQGRKDARSRRILATFLDELRLRITDPGGRQLHLDFVYGRWDAAASTLEPLDGQQRLTTLFLLHWYLAQLDAEQADLRSWLAVEGKSSRFTYRIRPSAEEFFDSLVREDVDLNELGSRRLSEWLADRTWFLRAWRLDPTVRGCLETLDEVDTRFRSARGSYRSLTAPDVKRVTFQLLFLHDFGLSDDLYIKMNARGKPLTPFEIFKAELQQHIEVVLPDEPSTRDPKRSWKDYTADQMDRAWTDFLWHHRDDRNEIDARFVQVVRAVVVVHCALEADSQSDAFDEKLEALLAEPEPSLSFYLQLQCVGPQFVKRMVALLDVLASSPRGHLEFNPRSDYYDENVAFRALLSPEGRFGVPLPEWAKLAAWAMFLLNRVDLGTAEARAALHEWMRVVSNLIENSDIDRIDRLVAALQALARIAADGAGDDFLSVVADDGEIAQGLNREQRLEEQLKAQLILGHRLWRQLLERAEAHLYLRGDIQFLLRFSGVWNRWEPTRCCDWSDEIHTEHQESFRLWYERFCAVFPPERRGLQNLAPQEFLWERALLAYGDYLLYSGRNSCLLHDQDRDASWKRLLRADTRVEDREERRDVVRRVLEQLDPADAVTSLRAIVGAGAPPDAPMWRRLLVSDARLLHGCGRRMLRFEDDTVYVLSSVRLSAYHADLFTLALYHQLLDRWKLGKLPGFDEPTHDWQHGQADVTSVVLSSKAGVRLRVCTEAGKAVLRLDGTDLGEAKADWTEVNGGGLERRVSWDDASSTVDAVLTALEEGASRSIAPAGSGQ